ncbi:hypothetical protein [Fodinicola acaciae]|uniref:hypothetical protein n=1 Tax=Fodinicola acaciae TaxID=2681555 RepID=UPI0013D553F2|nr:hypothetical protein [Fodinicola acaciae]
MRHVIGLILGILLAPAILIGVGWSSTRVSEAYAQYAFSLSDPTRFWLPLAVLLVCAIVFALLIASRISPIASFLVGLPFLVLGVLVAIPTVLTKAISVWPAVSTGLLSLAISGAALIIGLTGVLPVLIPSQWRRWRARPAAGGAADPGFGGQPSPVGGPTGSPLAGTAEPEYGDTLRMPGNTGYDGENTINWPRSPR